ncbi:MAG: glycosyltransferase [Syntrophomonadaceae bacterium]|nr:glycosyltransferase [Syntrophomonadaceae bacterium]
MIILVISSIIIAAALVSGFLLLWRIPLVQSIDGIEDKRPAESVSVIIPARNEALRLPLLLESLCQQEFQPEEIIVVDDQSTDSTAQIATAAGVQVISVTELEDGWIGKSKACWSGARLSAGEWLLFLDADTRLVNPFSLRRLLINFETLGGRGSLSVQPYHTVVRFYESLSAVFNIIVMAGMNVFTPWGTRVPSAGLFGPCMLCRRDDYFRVGGHEAIRGDVMEDLSLGQAFRKGGLPVHCLGGREVISFRMYPDGLAQLIEGWTKNFGTAASSTHPLIFAMIIAWISGGFSTLTLLLYGIRDSSLLWISAGILAYMFYALQLLWLARKVGNFHPMLFTVFPVLLGFFTLIFLKSFYQTKVLRTVSWRGRQVKV